MIINNPSIYKKAETILKHIYGADAKFRDGQYEAIEAAVSNKRTIVVQKTGWGKSLVYFMAAKLLREQGITIVISPLLVLIDNQIDAANRLGMKCCLLNSTIKDKEKRSSIISSLVNEECDIFFTTPETLYSNEIQQVITNLNISLFVIDECHCISDWGHDFRLEYGKLNKIIAMLPSDVSVLGTTATANDRVIADLNKQFGENAYLCRGPLTRESLHIEILKLSSRPMRYAWLAKNLNKIPGNGIIYCITQKDCDRLSDFLNMKGISAKPYHSGIDAELNAETENQFKNNNIKVIVATIKLGMGYDKNDISFVIHFQRPSSLVAYYQQIGRAGRKEGVEAYCYLMTGDEDRKINEYFVKNAFPTFQQEQEIVNALENATNGLKEKDLVQDSNISLKALKRSEMFLMNQGIIFQDWSSKKFFRTVKPYNYQGEYYTSIRGIKLSEIEDVEKFINHNGCLSKYVVNAMNDSTACDCGKCFNCVKKGILEGITLPSKEEVIIAQNYLGNLYNEIEPRKLWGSINNPFDIGTKISIPNEVGIALSKYNDAGYGEMVAYDKYHANSYRKELVEKTIELLKEKIGDQGYSVVSNIPSARNTKVAEFAMQVAKGLGLKYIDLLTVTNNDTQQKNMQNSYYQYKNAVEKIVLKNGINQLSGANIILIDDLVDSKWTLTVAGGYLHKAGAGKVYPFCLADSSQNEG